MNVRTTLLALAAASGLASMGLSVPARATVSDPGPGVLCGFTSVTDPTTEGGAQTTEIDGGPLTLLNDDNTPGTGTLICTVQVNEADHTATDGVSASASGTGVVYLPPTIASYNAAVGDSVYLCTTYVDQDGTTLYWNDSNDPTVDGSWSTSPTASCGLAASAGAPGRAAVYPTGDVNITGMPDGSTQVAYGDFTPPFLLWTCSQSSSSVTCTPPDPPRHTRNVCGTVTVEAQNAGPGSVYGSSACDAGGGASTVSGPFALTPSAGAAVVDGDFAWTCDAAPFATVGGAWHVHCHVGQGDEVADGEGDGIATLGGLLPVHI